MLGIYMGNLSEHPPCTGESEISFPFALTDCSESQISKGASAAPVKAQPESARSISQIVGFVFSQEANECPQQPL